MILALDQHAMHERINLEQLEKAYKANSYTDEENLSIFTNFASTTVPIAAYKKDWGEINIDMRTYHVLRESQVHLQAHGVEYRLSHSAVIFTKLPVIFGTALTPESVISSTLTTLKPPIPPFAHEILKSKACKYAVKFGQKLTTEAAAVLVKLL